MGLSQTSEVSRREILTIDRVVQTLERFTKPLEELKGWARRNNHVFLRRRHFEGDGSRTSGLGNCRWARCSRGGRYNCGSRCNFGRSCRGRGRRTSRCSGSGSGSNCGSGRFAAGAYHRPRSTSRRCRSSRLRSIQHVYAYSIELRPTLAVDSEYARRAAAAIDSFSFAAIFLRRSSSS